MTFIGVRHVIYHPMYLMNFESLLFIIPSHSSSNTSSWLISENPDLWSITKSKKIIKNPTVLQNKKIEIIINQNYNNKLKP